MFDGNLPCPVRERVGESALEDEVGSPAGPWLQRGASIARAAELLQKLVGQVDALGVCHRRRALAVADKSRRFYLGEISAERGVARLELATEKSTRRHSIWTVVGIDNLYLTAPLGVLLSVCIPE